MIIIYLQLTKALSYIHARFSVPIIVKGYYDWKLHNIFGTIIEC